MVFSHKALREVAHHRQLKQGKNNVGYLGHFNYRYAPNSSSLRVALPTKIDYLLSDDYLLLRVTIRGYSSLLVGISWWVRSRWWIWL